MPRMADKARAQESSGDEDKDFSNKTKGLIWIVQKNTCVINDLLQTLFSVLGWSSFFLNCSRILFSHADELRRERE